MPNPLEQWKVEKKQEAYDLLLKRGVFFTLAREEYERTLEANFDRLVCCEKCYPKGHDASYCHNDGCPCHSDLKTYARDYSHYHCWNQGGAPACGIPLEKHEQCCLCDLKQP